MRDSELFPSASPRAHQRITGLSCWTSPTCATGTHCEGKAVPCPAPPQRLEGSLNGGSVSAACCNAPTSSV
eukprot:2492997-Amphidinium_carterae.2